MDCNCQTTSCIDLLIDPCDELVELPIIPEESGVFTVEVDFLGAVKYYTTDVCSTIQIPVTAFNENHTHKVVVKDELGGILNDTCYIIKTRFYREG